MKSMSFFKNFSAADVRNWNFRHCKIAWCFNNIQNPSNNRNQNIMMSVDYSSGSTKLTIKNKIGLHTSRKATVEGTSIPESLEKKKKKKIVLMLVQDKIFVLLWEQNLRTKQYKLHYNTHKIKRKKALKWKCISEQVQCYLSGQELWRAALRGSVVFSHDFKSLCGKKL